MPEAQSTLVDEASLEIMLGLFSFLAIQETNAVHVNVGAGSYLEINIPMTVGENGELRLSLICFRNVFPEQ